MADAFRQSDCGARAHAKRSSCDDNARRHGHKHDRFSRRGISERSTGRASGPDQGCEAFAPSGEDSKGIIASNARYSANRDGPSFSPNGVSGSK
jgi:hypothetical protein